MEVPRSEEDLSRVGHRRAGIWEGPPREIARKCVTWPSFGWYVPEAWPGERRASTFELDEGTKRR
jgi:hypothetical protein